MLGPTKQGGHKKDEIILLCEVSRVVKFTEIEHILVAGPESCQVVEEKMCLVRQEIPWERTKQ